MLRISLLKTVTVVSILILVQLLPAVRLPDFDGNGTVDFTDFLLFVTVFGSKEGDPKYDSRFDLNSDGIIDFSDFLIFADSYGQSITELQFGVSSLAKAGESAGVIILEAGNENIYRYVLSPTQDDYAYKSSIFDINERTGEVQLVVDSEDWNSNSYTLDVNLQSQDDATISSIKLVIYKKPTATVSSQDNLNEVLREIVEPTTVAFSDGIYKDLGYTAFSNSGEGKYNTIEFRAINPGSVVITGYTAFDISGSYLAFRGFVFNNIRTNLKIGRTQFVVPITIRGDHNRITECVFYPRDKSDWAERASRASLIATSLRDDDKVARFTRIDHCAFISMATLKLDNTHIGSGMEHDQAKDNPITIRVDHNFFQNAQNSFLRLGRAGIRGAESILDANLIAGNREGDNEHFVGKMGDFLWFNNTMMDCEKYLSLRAGGYAYILHSYFMQRSAKAVISWDKNHVFVGNYFLSGEKNPEAPRQNVLQLAEGGVGPDSGHNATTDWVVAYNIFDTPSDVAFINFMGKPRTKHLEEKLGEAQQAIQEGTYTHDTPPEERYRFTYSVRNSFVGNLFYHRESVRYDPSQIFSYLHYGVWDRNTFLSNLVSSPVTEIYEYDTSNKGEDSPVQVSHNLISIPKDEIFRDHNGLIRSPVIIPSDFEVPNYNVLPINVNSVVHKDKDNFIDKSHPLFKVMDLRDIGDKLSLNRPLTTRDVGPRWDWQPLYEAFHESNPYRDNYK